MDAERGLIRRVTAEEVRPLRHTVLRPGQAFEETVYPGDDAGVHLAAFDGERLVGIASLLSLIHISEPTRPRLISYAVFCLKKKK